VNAVSSIKIDQGIPLPGRNNTRGGPGKWPWTEMRPGDSFFAAGYVQTKVQGDAPTFSTRWGANMVPGSKWATRFVTENGVQGVRVWRVA
jgi:hypothetical protein